MKEIKKNLLQLNFPVQNNNRNFIAIQKDYIQSKVLNNNIIESLEKNKKNNSSGSLILANKILENFDCENIPKTNYSKILLPDCILPKNMKNSQIKIKRIRNRIDLNKSMDYLKQTKNNQSNKYIIHEFGNKINMNQDFSFHKIR